ncbi:MAG: DUF3137 domain-containing protein [Alphaproteobacteria bacterium]|nr:MAG: DUF3137 domain-containing protein [Alphaproteobacteria bacterium]
MTESSGAGEETEDNFLQRIKPELDQMEIMRQVKLDAYLWRQKMIWPIGCAVIACTIVLDYLISHYLFKLHFPFPLVSIMAGIGLFIWMGNPRKEYVNIYKENITPRIARLVGLSQYDPAGGIPLNDMDKSRILPGHSGYESEDYFEGIYKKALVRFAQVKFTKSQRKHGVSFSAGGVTLGSSRRHRNYETVTVFKGLALLISLPHPTFRGHTILVRDSASFSEWLTSAFTGLKSVPLSKPGLEKMYSVFSNNAAEADRLIDAEMLSRVVRLAEAYKSRGVSLAFYGNQIFILIAAEKDFFEPGNIAMPATNIESVRSIKRELQQVFSLIDFLGVVNQDGAAPAASIS